jgi:hypothetical protein
MRDACESLFGRVFGGMPTDWVTKPETSLIAMEGRRLASNGQLRQ